MTPVERTEENLDPLANPYAPPTASAGAPARRRGKFSNLVWVYVALQSLTVATCAAEVAGWIALPVGMLLAVAAAGVGLAWLYGAWDRLPERLQVVDGHRYTATTVLLRHFIPLYNLYWMFRAQQLLCGALDARLKEKERGGAAPSGMATLACTFQFFGSSAVRAFPLVGSLVVTVACGVAWTAYMFAIEQCFAQAFRKSTTG